MVIVRTVFFCRLFREFIGILHLVPAGKTLDGTCISGIGSKGDVQDFAFVNLIRHVIIHLVNGQAAIDVFTN